MENNTQKLDIYRFINSKDVAEHCRKINHQFGTTEMAKLIYMSRLSNEEKMQGYKWLIDNAPDDAIPDMRWHIPYFAFVGYYSHSGRLTDEERRTHTEIIKGRDSVLEYLKQCTESGSFVDCEDASNNLNDINIHIPHPFKVGDLLEHILS